MQAPTGLMGIISPDRHRCAIKKFRVRGFVVLEDLIIHLELNMNNKNSFQTLWCLILIFHTDFLEEMNRHSEDDSRPVKNHQGKINQPKSLSYRYTSLEEKKISSDYSASRGNLIQEHEGSFSRISDCKYD